MLYAGPVLFAVTLHKPFCPNKGLLEHCFIYEVDKFCIEWRV